MSCAEDESFVLFILHWQSVMSVVSLAVGEETFACDIIALVN